MTNKLYWFIKLSVADIENEMLMGMGQNGRVSFEKVQYREGQVRHTMSLRGIISSIVELSLTVNCYTIC